MKKVITIVSILVLSLAAGAAFADDFAVIEGKDIGAVLYDESLMRSPVITETWASTPAEPVGIDVGLALFESSRIHEEWLAKAGARGFAAGGVGAEKAITDEGMYRFYLGPGGSDLP
jgi:hypothetical protein